MGHAVTLGMVAFGAAVYTVLWWSYVTTNRKRVEGREDWIVEGKDEDFVRELGDEAYVITFPVLLHICVTL